MRLLILGATGGTGRELVRQALERGHAVTAFVRTPAKLDGPDAAGGARDGLRVVRGDVGDAAALAAAVAGHEAVLSALGTKRLGPTTLLSEAARTVVGAMQRHGVPRLVWESSLGVGATRGQLGPLYNRLLIPLFLRHMFADKERQEEIVRASPLSWTVVQPGVLTNGPRTGRYRAGPGAPPGRRTPRISRADVADFMLGALERPELARQTVALSY